MQAGSNQAVITAEKGRRGNPAWRKGVSGNPGGKPKTPPNVKALAIDYTVEAVETLATCMKDTAAPWSTRTRCAEILIERGHGRAPITVDPEAANAVGASFVALLDQIAREHTPQVEQHPMINVTPEPNDG